MAWVRVDDAFYDHPKFLRITAREIGYFFVSIAWSNRNRTNGDLPASVVARLVLQDSDAPSLLVGAGLWELAEDGYRIHDYLDYQPRAEDVEVARGLLSEVRSRAGKKGAHVRWSHRHNGKDHGKSIANAEQTDSPKPKPKNQNQNLSRDEVFARCWGEYPRKLNRAGALKAFVARLKAGATPTELLTATRHYAESMKGKEARFILYGSTFYGPDDRWRDYLAAPILDVPTTNGRRPDPLESQAAAARRRLIPEED